MLTKKEIQRQEDLRIHQLLLVVLENDEKGLRTVISNPKDIEFFRRLEAVGMYEIWTAPNSPASVFLTPLGRAFLAANS